VSVPAAAGGFRLGSLRVEPPLLLAPMADLSGHAFREAVRAYGGCGLFYSEMLNSRRVPTEPDESEIFLGFGQEDRLLLQVLGDDPQALARSVERLERFQPAGFDWNLGCTRSKITHWGWGASLLRDPRAAARALAALRRATARPLTVKLRIPDDPRPDALAEFARLLESEGADGITVHARTPEMRFARPARWERIAEVKARVRVPVIGNGDVFSVEDALAMFARTGCDGVMIGRGAAARPYLFRDVAAALAGQPLPEAPAPAEVLDRVLASFGEDLQSPKRAKEFKTFCQYFAESLPVPHWFWAPLQSLRTGPELARMAKKYFIKTPA
jgi:tRNA-dihydrouridine synthase B